MGVLGLSALSGIQAGRIRSHKISAPDYCYGLLDSGRLDKVILMDILNSLPSGTSELVCHPGLAREDLSNKYKWGYSWSKELAALTSQTVKDVIRERDIRLIRYDEI